MVWCLQFKPPFLTLPQHTRTQTHTHTRSPHSSCSSQRCSTASVCVLREPAAPWKHFPPSLPTSLSVISASFLTIHAFLGWVSESVRPKRETKKKTDTIKRKKENRDVTDHQHAGYCRCDQEGELLERLERPGYWCVYCPLSVLCGFERWTITSACRLNIHDTTGVYTWVCVCSACTHLSSNCFFKVLWNQTQYIPAPPLTRTRPGDRSFLLHVCASEKKQRRGRWETLVGVMENHCIHTRVLGAICFACMLIWVPVLCCGTKACHCYHTPHFATVQGSWFYMAYALFLCSEAVRASGRLWQTVSMVTRAHPSWLHQPYLLGCHGTLQRLGQRRASSVCLFP